MTADNSMPSPQDLMRNAQSLRERSEALIESNRVMAKLMKATFDGLVDEGFTPSEALEIVKARGPFLAGGSS